MSDLSQKDKVERRKKLIDIVMRDQMPNGGSFPDWKRILMFFPSETDLNRDYPELSKDEFNHLEELHSSLEWNDLNELEDIAAPIVEKLREKEDESFIWNQPESAITEETRNHYSKFQKWEFEEGIAIILGKDPQKLTRDAIDKCNWSDGATPTFKTKYYEYVELSERSDITFPATPNDFILWAEKMGIKIESGIRESLYLSSKNTRSLIHPVFDDSRIDHPRELCAALIAWNAVALENYGNQKDTPRKRIVQWLNTNENFGKEAQNRIAIIANWHKGGPTKMDE